jgi:hypothetical protein
MCFSSDQHPPLPPRSSDVGDHGPTVLTAADGTRLAAYDAVPVTRRGASLVLLPDIRGMHPYYTDLAIAFPKRASTPSRSTRMRARQDSVPATSVSSSGPTRTRWSARL